MSFKHLPPMFIITTEKIENQNGMPQKEKRSWKSGKSTMTMEVWMDIEVCVYFWNVKNIRLSAPTVQKYMNRELRLLAMVRCKKAKYQTRTPHKVFPKLNPAEIYSR